MNLVDRAARIAAVARVAEDADRARARVLAELVSSSGEPTDSSALARQLAALLELARDRERGDLDLAASLARVTEIAVDLLGIRRAGVWFFSPDASSLECADMYDSASAAHTTGAVLFRRDFPIYFATLSTVRVLDASDANTDPRTREFSGIYFRRHGIAATLDAPIRRRGGLGGVLCCEHFGAPRVWSDDEQAFVASLADAITLALETDRRRAAERALVHKLAVIKAHQQEIATLTSPVLEVWDGVVALPLIGALDPERLAAVQSRLPAAVTRHQAAWIVLDLTAADALDAVAADVLVQLAAAVHRLGAVCVLSGLSPDAAAHLAELKPELALVAHAPNLKGALRHCLGAVPC